MAHVNVQPRARPNLPPVPPQLREPVAQARRPTLPPVPSDYISQAAPDQHRLARWPSALGYPPASPASLRQPDTYTHPTHAVLSGYLAGPEPPPVAFPAPSPNWPPGHRPPLGRTASHQNSSPSRSPRLNLNTSFPTPILGSPHSAVSSPSTRKVSLPVIDLELLTQQYDECFHVHDTSRQVRWSGKVLKFIERSQAEPKLSSAAGSDPNTTSATTTRISDPLLVKYTDIALRTIIKHATAPQPVPEAVYLRADLASTGSFPSYQAKDPKLAFREFEAAANLGYKLAWFRIGREYEAFEDWDRAISAYEHGLSLRECASTYRLGMSYFLGQLQLPADVIKAVAHLKSAADLADEDTPQPAYIYGMLLAGEFESLPHISPDILHPNPAEAKFYIEKAAYLGFAAAQYKMGWLYEYSQLGCSFDPLLSVEYYSLASKQGEIEADMALSKWFLCGSEGHFAPNESLAVTFADKAARQNLPSAMFAIGYYLEIGIGGSRDLELAKKWYERAYREGNNDDAKERLECLAEGGATLSRNEHESHLDQKLVRKHTLAAQRSPYDALKPSGVRRRETMRKVEEAKRVAEIGYLTSSPPRNPGPILSPPLTADRRGFNINDLGPPGRPSQPPIRTPSRTPSPHTPSLGREPSAPGRAPIHRTRPGGYQLSDDGPTMTSSGQPIKTIATTSGVSRPSANQSSTTFNSFADMGIQTAKAKKTEDCVVM